MENNKQIEEIGGTFHLDKQGKYQPGDGPAPEPYKMAEKVAKNLNLHPDYFKYEELFESFIYALHEVLLDKLESGEFSVKKKQKNNISLNENIEKVKKNFKRFL